MSPSAPVPHVEPPFKGFSKALFSTWIYHRRFGALFDAGEGVATVLMNRVFGIRRVFLSHGHADHIAGLINLINIRNLGAGDQTQSLTIHFPRGNHFIETIRQYLTKTQNELSFALEWLPIEADERIELDDKRGKTFMRTFRTQHSQKQLSLGFNIFEQRRRLRPEFVGKPQEEINAAVRTLGKDRVSESFDQIIFTYGGDSRPINPELVRDSLLLCHECTYLNAGDDERNFQQHSTLDEVLEVAKAAHVKGLLLFHLSVRYTIDEIRNQVQAALHRHGLEISPLILFGENFWDLSSRRPLRPARNDQGSERHAPAAGTQSTRKSQISDLTQPGDSPDGSTVGPDWEP